MNYILGGAYKSLLFALYLKNVLGEKITIITYKTDLIKFCEDQNIDYIKFDKIKIDIFSIHKIFTLKKMLDNIIKEIDINGEDRFFLTGNAKGYDWFYLAKELSKKGVGYYKNTDRDFGIYEPPWYKPIFFRGAPVRLMLKHVMGLNLVYYEYNNAPCFGIDDNFLKEHNIAEYLPGVSSEELIFDAVKKNKLNYKKYDNLIIDDGPFTKVMKLDSMINLYINLFELPIEFAFKKRPHALIKSQSVSSYYELFKHCEELPSHIPVELFCNNIKKNVISISSTSLITASQLEHLNAVSLLELVDWCNESYKEEFKQHLMEASKNKIIFPNSFEELNKILLEDNV